MGYTAITHVENSQGTKVDIRNLIPQPASMEVEIEDISERDAGRTADTYMQKKTMRTICALSLSWHNLHTLNASAVLKTFNPKEYFRVTYLDPYEGSYQTKTFYLGNRTVPMYSAELDVWSNISFKLVER